MDGSGTTVAVVGGGPAGLMAAEVLVASGASVTVYEHRRSVGRKLLLAGRSGLNLTHSEPFDRFLSRYEELPAPLEAALRAFTPDDLRTWAADLGAPTYIGSSGRVFPEAFKASPLLRAWLARLTAAGVVFRTGHRWVGWGSPGTLRFEADGETVEAAPDAAVIAVGGASWPRVGSDGRWVGAFSDRGIDVRPLEPSNCGVAVAWSDVFRDRFEGTPIKNVVVDAAGRRTRGEIVVTRDGLEGGPIYASSSSLRRMFAVGERARLSIDVAPDLSDARFLERLATRRPKDSQTTWLRRAALSPVVVGLLREATANALPDDPAALVALSRSLPVDVTALMPLDRAISTAGGVPFDAIDERFMLRDEPGTFVAGEMLDWDAPTGGYLLQACMSTGVAAARGALDFLNP